MTVVAIDGPAGAGKSTVARAVAEALGFAHLDTGALYRAVALAALERGVPLDDPDALGRLARTLELRPQGDRILLDGRDVSERIRDADVTAAVSVVAAAPQVRAALVELQRAATRGDVVIEGRDIGSVVVPDADVKIFLTASLEERARRRADQLGLGEDAVEEIKLELERRDRADSRRSTSPLMRAPDARVVDTSGRAVEDVVAEIVAVVKGAEGG